MNATQSVLVFAVATVVTACSTMHPTPPEAVVKNMKPVLEIEEQARNLTRQHQALALSGWIAEDGNRAFKEHYDVYYIYHAAAISHLAHGEISRYLQCVDFAKTELKAMKEILDETEKRASRDRQKFRRPRQQRPDPIPNWRGDPT